MSTTLYWHDYETFGVDPRRDRPTQFAGLRTDEALNEIGEPLVVYCKPTRDVLPHPEACLLTGITPQLADAEGVPEPVFIARIHAQLAQPGTCGVGYNTLRFDDEVTRFTLYRNFYDPYIREWQQGNSRWDLIDLVRMAYALRPQGIEWPKRDDGRPGFKLEDLASANAIGHESAHDALSDVRATLGLARLIRDRQPRLYDWLFQLRDKRKAAEQLDLNGHKPVLHTSRMYPPEIGCTSLVMPLLGEPGNKNSVLVYDLRHDPEPFMALNEEDLHDRLFTRAEDLPEGVERLPVKSVKINKCPALAPRKTLDAVAAKRIAIDLDACTRHWELLRTSKRFMQRVAKAYSRRTFSPAKDVDLALYEGFLNDADRLLLGAVRDASPQELSQNPFNFHDKRLPELLFRYRARNWPETLSAEETQRWDRFCRHRIQDEDGGGSITLKHYYERIALLRDERDDEPAQRILDALDEWGNIT
ncbi:Exodeoxyribonuclease I [hydrothermal vent metagenome]|uniref:Exodeoxyribonuclease I n=1 Tax=hydrothermal vent metagenome TaxID=652676 RepID=A0A3B0YIW0_9ZZZZ